MTPTRGVAILLIVGGLLTGVLASLAPTPRTRLLALPWLLGAGQALAHWTLMHSAGARPDPTTTVGAAGMPGMAHGAGSMPMMTAHAAAVAVAAVMIATAEAVAPAGRRVLATLRAPAFVPATAVPRRTVAAPARQGAHATLFVTTLPRRGPPVGA